MKCVICGEGQLEEKIVEYKELGIPFGKFKAKVCSKCGEQFFDSETAKKIQAKSKEIGLFAIAKKTKVAQFGNSLAIRIPKEIADFMKLKKEKNVSITPKNAHEMIVTTS